MGDDHRHPSPGPLPNLVPRQTAHPVPTPLPPVAVRARKRRAIRLALYLAAAAALVLSTLISAGFLVLVVIGVVAGRWLKVDDGGEGQRRKADLVRAMQQWKALQERWTREAGDAPLCAETGRPGPVAQGL